MGQKLELFYLHPATRWEETLPMGNGSLGAMIWGGVTEEKIGLNEESLWSGYEREKNNPGAFAHLADVRELIFQGKCAEAERLIQKHMLAEYNESYMPLGNLHIKYLNIYKEQEVTNYVRRLDLEEALATVDFRVGQTDYHREIFVSYPGKGIAVRLGASAPVMDMELRLQSELCLAFHAGGDVAGEGCEGEKREVEGCINETCTSYKEVLSQHSALYFEGRCPEHLDPSYIRKGEEAVVWGYRGRRFCGCIRIQSCDGKISILKDSIQIEGATEVIFTIEAVKKSEFTGDYAAMKEEHIRDYQSIFRKMELYLGEQKDLPTDVRLQRLKDGGADNGLFALYFQYGRYLMIASSRKGSLPANLQGIWCWDFQAPWSCNWTTNINLEMNYWPALTCGLEECLEPYFTFVEKLMERGRRTAAIHYHCRGSVHHHNADGWYATNPVGVGFGEEGGRDGCVVWSMWPMGLAWLAQQFFRYYEYTKNVDFLKKHAYPIYREVALFLVDWLVEYEGQYVTCPSTSPENRFYTAQGERCSVTMASAMDMEITEEVFGYYLKICEILGIQEVLMEEVKARWSKLAPVRLGSHGQILEWFHEYEEVEPGHRHVSHLYGLFPAELWAQEERMTEAAHISLEHRLQNGGGYTGWSCAWIINLFAILGDGEKAWEFLHTLLVRSTYPNLWDAHEPFQIDGNFGGIAGMCNMLVQDRGGEVKLLPALPKQFASGYAKGIRIKGGKTVDISWENGEVVSVMEG